MSSRSIFSNKAWAMIFIGLLGFTAAASAQDPCKNKFCTQGQGYYTSEPPPDSVKEEALSVHYAFYSYQECLNQLQETSEVSSEIFTSGNQGLQKITDFSIYCHGYFPDNSTFDPNPKQTTSDSVDLDTSQSKGNGVIID